MTSAALIPTTPPVDGAQFKRAMAATVSGVHIVTTDGPAGRFGLTVSAVASVSAEPAMLLVSIHRNSPLVAAILVNGVFGVSALGSHHAELADTFAGRPWSGAPYDFDAAQWDRTASGVPLLADAAAHFDCSVGSAGDAGTHTVIIGTVQAASRGVVTALAYSRRRYARTQALADPSERTSPSLARACQ